MPRPAAVVFDAFGTLFDVDSPMRRHAARIGPDWRAASREWRNRSLEYTWVRSLAGEHVPFSALSREALEVVAQLHGMDAALVEDIAEANRSLDLHADVAGVLHRLGEAGVACAILSNGERAGMERQVSAAGIAGRFDVLLSVEAVGVFKPDPRTYRMAVQRFGPAGGIAFVSSNPWDAFGAAAFGLRACWVNRAGQAVEYGLGGRASVVADLAALADLLLGDATGGQDPGEQHRGGPGPGGPGPHGSDPGGPDRGTPGRGETAGGGVRA